MAWALSHDFFHLNTGNGGLDFELLLENWTKDAQISHKLDPCASNKQIGWKLK